MPIDLPPPSKIEVRSEKQRNQYIISDASNKTNESKLMQAPLVAPRHSKPNLPKYDPPLKGLVHFSKGPMAFPEIESMRIPDGWTEEYVMPIGAPGPRYHHFEKKGDNDSVFVLACSAYEDDAEASKLLETTLKAPPHIIEEEELQLLREKDVAHRGLPVLAQISLARTVDWNGKRVIESQGIDKDNKHFYAITYSVMSIGRAPLIDSTIKFEAKEAIFLKYLPAMKKSMRSIKWTDSNKVSSPPKTEE